MGTLALMAFLAIESGAIGILEWDRGNRWVGAWFTFICASCCVCLAYLITSPV